VILWCCSVLSVFFFFSSRRRHTRFSRDWSSDVCSSDLFSKDQRIEEGDPVGQRGQVDWQLHRVTFTQPEGTVYITIQGTSMGERSEERRVGKECRSRRAQDHY